MSIKVKERTPALACPLACILYIYIYFLLLLYTVYKKISNNFIDNTLHNSSLGALKIVYYLSTVLKDFDYNKDLNTLMIDTKTMLEYTELTLQDIKRNLKKLQETTISFINEKENWEEYIALLPRVKIHLGRKRKIEIDIYSKIARLVLEVVDNYTFIDTKELMRLKFKHSIRLLPFLKTILGYKVKQKTLILSDLNDFFGTSYKRYIDIERKILLQAKEELDNNSNLTFDFEMNFEQIGKAKSRIVSITIIPIEKKSSKNKMESKQQNLSEPIVIEATQNENDFSDLYSNMLDINLHEEYDISANNSSLIKLFYKYIKEQVIVFKEFCIDNNKNYKNIKTSFKRHIKGAYNNKLDFFVIKEYLNRQDFEDKIKQEIEDQKIKEFLTQFEGKKLCEYKFDFNDKTEDIYVLGAELYVKDKETKSLTLVSHDREQTIEIINSLKK